MAAWFDPIMVPDPAAWLTKRLGELSRFDQVEPTASPILAPELAAMRAMTTISDAEKLARRATLRPTPLEFHNGCVPMVLDGYGDLLACLPGMRPIRGGNVTDIFTITWNTGTLLVMTSELVILMTEHGSPSTGDGSSA